MPVIDRAPPTGLRYMYRRRPHLHHRPAALVPCRAVRASASASPLPAAAAQPSQPMTGREEPLPRPIGAPLLLTPMPSLRFAGAVPRRPKAGAVHPLGTRGSTQRPIANRSQASSGNGKAGLTTPTQGLTPYEEVQGHARGQENAARTSTTPVAAVRREREKTRAAEREPLSEAASLGAGGPRDRG